MHTVEVDGKSGENEFLPEYPFFEILKNENW